MKKAVLTFFTILAFLAVSGKALALTLGVPSYTYPGSPDDFWGKSSMVQAGSIYVANPASGAGTSKDTNYYAAIQNAHRHGVKVFGYVYTHYGKRAQAEIRHEASLYQSWYGVDGIFLDETQADANHLAYYAQISMALRGLGLKVALNPGQPQFEARYVQLADHIVSFEGNYSAYLSASFPDWVNQYPASKFWHIVYGVSNVGQLEKTVIQANRRHAGVLFVTNDTLPNPYDSVPPYWRFEIKTFGVRE